ncbi:MAG: galactose-1-phosphate uridylyltransferase, partial [Clostridia bacterium]
MNISQLISNLVFYARARLDLPQSDIIYVTNRLLEALGETAYTQCPNEDFVSNIASPDRVVAPLAQYAKEKGIISSVEEEAFACKLLDIVSLRPSQIIDKFYALHAFDKKSAFDYLYNYGVYSDYIKSTAIAKNIMWSADKTKGKLVITINLSKPEKSNKDTAKLLSNTTATYPKCAICPENIGYCGRGVVRQTLRAIPIILGREKWVWQFSPYAYFYQHGIAINCKHTPMKVDGNTIVKLLDFVEYAPQYFIGCNAALPIVGGSILTHDHFQGGAQLLPMHSASVLKWYTCIESKVNIGILDWYNSVIYLESADRKAV